MLKEIRKVLLFSLENALMPKSHYNKVLLYI